MTRHYATGLSASCLFVLSLLTVTPTTTLRAVPAEAPSTIPAEASPHGESEPVPAGFLLNGRLAGQMVIYHARNDYWIPYRLFIAKSGLVETDEHEKPSRFRTSIGTVAFDKAELRIFENQPCISFASLAASFRVRASFDNQLSAAVLDIPWIPSREETQKQVAPDVSAPAGSLSFISIDAGIQRDFREIASNSLQLQAGGRAATGVWDIDIEGDPATSMEARRYHWSAFNDHFALRLGTGTQILSPITPDSELTGLHFGWDNRGIIDYIDSSGRSASDLFVSSNRNLDRSIEGKGPVAGIAELRFDGRIAAKMRIRLDGRFVFENVRMGVDPRRTEVYLYERSAEEPPLAVLDYTQSVMNGSLSGGELLVRGGAGSSGNPIAARGFSTEGKPAGYGQLQYGVNDRLTLDATARYNPATATGEFSAGTTCSVGGNWAASFYETQADRAYSSDLRIEGRGRRTSLSWWSQWNQRDFGFVGGDSRDQHLLRLTGRPSDRLTLLLYGRESREEGKMLVRYLLPGGYLSPIANLSIAAVPNDNGHYRYEARRTFSPTSDLSLIHEHGVSTVEWIKSLRENLSVRVFNEYAFRTGNDLTGFYLDWFPRNSRLDLVEVGASRSGSEYGLTGKWNRYLNTGLKVSLQYAWNMAQAKNLITTNELADSFMPPGSRHFISCVVSWDLGFSGRRAFPIDRNAISMTRGGLAGRLEIAPGAKASPSDINGVGILVDGRRLEQRQVNGSFFVGNLKPGIHTVTVDADRLPIELEPTKKRLLVEVRNGAVTKVDIPVQALYGIAGRLTGHGGQGVGDAVVEIVDSLDRVVAMVDSNEFGEYRADGLPPGSYRIRVISVKGLGVDGCPPRTVMVEHDFLKRIDLTLDAKPEAESSIAGNRAAGSTTID